MQVFGRLTLCWDWPVTICMGMCCTHKTRHLRVRLRWTRDRDRQGPKRGWLNTWLGTFSAWVALAPIAFHTRIPMRTVFRMLGVCSCPNRFLSDRRNNWNIRYYCFKIRGTISFLQVCFPLLFLIYNSLYNFDNKIVRYWIGSFLSISLLPWYGFLHFNSYGLFSGG